MAVRAFLLVLLAARAAAAQEPPAGGEEGDGAQIRREIRVEDEAPPPADLVNPVPLGDLGVPRPEDAPASTEPVLVQVVIGVDENGEVDAVRVEKGAGPPWDDAVLHAATRFRFEPARQGGVPVAVEIPFLVRFMPEIPEPAADGGPARTAVLEGHLVEKGTGRPLVDATLTATIGDRDYETTSGADGAFRLELPPGSAQVEIVVPGYREFHQVETLVARESVAVRYLVERQRYNPFETIVIGQKDREEVSRTTLRGRELSRVPGSFGDPFRAIGAMPGVASVFSLLGWAVVRGTSPGNTGFLIDGVAVPQLFHYLAGPAVVHPLFIDRIDFHAGGFPVRYGGYTGGIVDGITAAPREPDHLRLSLDPLKSSALVHVRPDGGGKITAAGRLGYPALILGLIGDDLTASYWDYQARWESADGRLSAFAFGSFDSIGAQDSATTEETTGSEDAGLHSMFHRLDLRYRTGDVDDFELWMLTAGYDDVAGGDNGTTVRSPSIVPRVQVERRLSDSLRLRGGVDVTHRRSTGEVLDADVSRLQLQSWRLGSGVWADLPWKVTGDLTLTPGLRLDLYLSDEAGPGGVVTQATIDPRILWRYRLLPPERGETFLKGSLGVYSQPPRLPVAVPGIDQVGLSSSACPNVFAVPSDCMLQSSQASVGVERELGEGYSVDAQVYYAWMDPIYFDFTINPASSPLGTEDEIDLYLDRRQGRSYGLELLLRKRDQGTFFGWISYTLARSERLHGEVWKPYDFDRTHVVHVVGGLQLPRNWELGARLLFQTGRPATGPYQPLERVDPFWRLDLRVDKRVVYDGMLFDFYVEVLNAAVVPEGLTAESRDAAPYVFPFAGLEWILPL